MDFLIEVVVPAVAIVASVTALISATILIVQSKKRRP